MELQTIDYWDETLWQKAEPVFHQGFQQNGRKNRKIIHKLFEKKLCFLHVTIHNQEVIAMALTGKLDEVNALLIDYLAVRKDVRGQGIGRMLVEYIKTWAVTERQLDGIIIEVECEMNATNAKRIHFWKQCGFQLTDYIHKYIWVPEPYKAMYLNLRSTKELPEDGEMLFHYITNFHKTAYRGK